MPLTNAERIWLEKAEQAAIDPSVSAEGISIRIVVYLLRQIVQGREEIQALKDRVAALENPTP